MITHEEARDVLVHQTKMVWNELEFAKAYITQQEKKDKLLGLYQEKDAFASFIINGNDYFETSYFNVSEKIEQLKKELGEMK